MKEDEDATGCKLTTNHGLYHGGFVVGSVSTFSGSFFSTGMVT